jgi:hypothetical protein
MDSNKTRLKQKREKEKNKAAFVAIIGDPYNDIDGIYITLHGRSSISSIEANFGEATETVNPCKPSVSDFFCDVENALRDAIPNAVFGDFTFTYFGGMDLLSKKTRNQLEQKVGKLLRTRGIYPVKRYFTVNPKEKK